MTITMYVPYHGLNETSLVCFSVNSHRNKCPRYDVLIKRLHRIPYQILVLLSDTADDKAKVYGMEFHPVS